MTGPDDTPAPWAPSDPVAQAFLDDLAQLRADLEVVRYRLRLTRVGLALATLGLMMMALAGML